MPDVAPIKAKHGMPRNPVVPHRSSAATSSRGTPAEDIRRLLREKPAIVGLAAPRRAGRIAGWTPNSPGHDVIAFDKAGNTKVFATHKAEVGRLESRPPRYRTTRRRHSE